MKVGDKVMVKTYQKIPYRWSSKMRKWMGKAVNIRLVDGDCVYIEQDINEYPYNKYPGWEWCKEDFIQLSKDKDSIRHLLGGQICLK